ncbi:MAG TPA: hypothetical protein VFX76_14410 [Roseiflexaceae bacterium]|nr:hypothetical protein [Roseiflexaceae bacterium]
MTEQEHDRMLLSQLIEQPLQHSAATDLPLSGSVERKLLQEANRVAPATLAPTDIGERRTSSSFASEALDIVRRHPLPSLLIITGAAYLLTRRRR